MASGNEILTDLIFKISANSAELKAGLSQAQSQISSFSKGIEKIGGLIKGAFAATAIIGAAKSVFDFANEIDGVIGKLDDLGQSIDLALNAGKAKAIADVFETDIDKVIEAANATAQQFGISMNDALNMVQQGIALAGPKTEKYLKSLESQSASFASLGGSADEFFTIVTDGYRTSSDFEKQLKEGAGATTKSFSDLTAQMNDGQLIQQRLINASADLNAEWANLFDGTGDLVDTLKINLYELGTKSFKAIKQGIVDTINYFITLYNESMAFRLLIQGTILNFKTLWEASKLLITTLIDGFKNAGALLKAVFTGNFQAIPGIIKDAYSKAIDNGKEFANTTVENFKTAAQNVLSKQPIQLIGDSEITAQGTRAAQTFKKAFEAQEKGNTQLTNVEKVGGIKNQSLAPTGSFNATAQVDTSGMISQLTEVQAMWESIGETIENSLGVIAVNAIESVGGVLADLVTTGKANFGELVKSVLVGIGKMIQGLLLQAIASQIAAGSKAGLPGLILAAVGTAAVTALFAKLKVPAYAKGTNYASGGLSLVGEKGAELVNLPRGSQVIPNKQTQQLLSGGNTSLDITINGVFRGEDLFYQLAEVNRRRNYNS